MRSPWPQRHGLVRPDVPAVDPDAVVRVGVGDRPGPVGPRAGVHGSPDRAASGRRRSPARSRRRSTAGGRSTRSRCDAGNRPGTDGTWSVTDADSGQRHPGQRPGRPAGRGRGAAPRRPHPPGRLDGHHHHARLTGRIPGGRGDVASATRGPVTYFRRPGPGDVAQATRSPVTVAQNPSVTDVLQCNLQDYFLAIRQRAAPTGPVSSIRLHQEIR